MRKDTKNILGLIVLALCTVVITSCDNDDELAGTHWYARVVQIYPYGDSTNVYTYIDEFNFTSETDYTYSWQEKTEHYESGVLVNEQNNAPQHYSDTYIFSDGEGKVQMYDDEYDFSVTDDVLLFGHGSTTVRFGKDRMIKNDTMYMH